MKSMSKGRARRQRNRLDQLCALATSPVPQPGRFQKRANQAAMCRRARACHLARVPGESRGSAQIPSTHRRSPVGDHPPGRLGRRFSWASRRREGHCESLPGRHPRQTRVTIRAPLTVGDALFLSRTGACRDSFSSHSVLLDPHQQVRFASRDGDKVVVSSEDT